MIGICASNEKLVQIAFYKRLKTHHLKFFFVLF